MDRIQEASYIDLTFRIRWDNDRLDLYRTNKREIFICDQEQMSVYEHNEKKDPDWWMIVRNSIEFIECENEISVDLLIEQQKSRGSSIVKYHLLKLF